MCSSVAVPGPGWLSGIFLNTSCLLLAVVSDLFGSSQHPSGPDSCVSWIFPSWCGLEVSEAAPGFEHPLWRGREEELGPDPLGFRTGSLPGLSTPDSSLLCLFKLLLHDCYCRNTLVSRFCEHSGIVLEFSLWFLLPCVCLQLSLEPCQPPRSDPACPEVLTHALITSRPCYCKPPSQHLQVLATSAMSQKLHAWLCLLPWPRQQARVSPAFGLLPVLSPCNSLCFCCCPSSLFCAAFFYPCPSLLSQGT